MGKMFHLTGEIHIPDIVGYMQTVYEPNSFKSKSQNVTKNAEKFSQPFLHVLSRYV